MRGGIQYSLSILRSYFNRINEMSKNRAEIETPNAIVVLLGPKLNLARVLSTRKTKRIRK